MGSFNLLRSVCRFVVILSGIFALISIIADWTIGIIIGFVFITIGIIVIAIKNRCPFCHKPLRIGPIKGGEFCPYCGCEIK